MRRHLRPAPALGLLLLAGCGDPQPSEAVVAPPAPPPPVAIAQAPEGWTRYTLRLPEPHTHYLEVEASYPAQGAALELVMASWTPGSYKIRDYARSVEAVSASGPDGQALAVEKVAKNRWRVETGGAARVGVRYRVYCREMSVRTSWVDADYAMLNGAATFLAPADLAGPFGVTLALPGGWADAATGLDPWPEGGERAWVAPDFDQLLDSPIVAGDLTRFPFEVQGVPHELVLRGMSEVWDGEKSAADVQTVAEAVATFWGGVPYERYVFLNVIDEGGGGLEHHDSTLMLSGPWRTKDEEDYQGWLALVCHEFFHTWNVKRLRPEALGPFDYEHEVYTESLWVAEGVTSYYDDLLLVRAGLISEGEYLSALSEQIEAVQGAPGRAVRSLSEASFDAWIKFYQPDENSQNTTVNYYRKGAVVAWLLDMEIRRLTRGARSLDDVMRLAYSRFSGERGFSPEGFRAVASEVTGQDLSAWFEAAVDGTGELNYGPALEWLNLRFKEGAAGESKGWLGAEMSGGKVTGIERGTPAMAAGLNVGDEILAVEGWRAGDVVGLVGRWSPGEAVEVLISRRGRVRTVEVVLGEAPKESWELEKGEGAAGARAAWLSGR